jgi:hypothetical protein
VKNYLLRLNLVQYKNSICLTVSLGLKTEIGYSPTNITLIRMYKNSILVIFWRTFEIEIKDDQIKLKTFFQL